MINHGLVSEVKMLASSAAPDGWLICDGSAISRSTYSDLFNILNADGLPFGTGDGSTTFNIPDYRGRTPIGSGSGSGLSARSLGQTGGEETHALSSGEMPVHQHTYGGGSTFVASGGGTLVVTAGNGAFVSGSAGGNSAHNNMQPYGVVNYIIKY